MRRVAAVMYAVTPLRTRPAANSSATGQIHSRYSWGPRVTPALKARSPATTAAFHRTSASRESVGLHSGAREVRATTYRARPTSAIELQPQNTVLVWIGRTRPKESHGTVNASGQLSFKAARSPAAVPTSNQTVAHTRYSKVTRTVGLSLAEEARRVGSWLRRWSMATPPVHEQSESNGASDGGPRERGRRAAAPRRHPTSATPGPLWRSQKPESACLRRRCLEAVGIAKAPMGNSLAQKCNRASSGAPS